MITGSRQPKRDRYQLKSGAGYPRSGRNFKLTASNAKRVVNEFTNIGPCFIGTFWVVYRPLALLRLTVLPCDIGAVDQGADQQKQTRDHGRISENVVDGLLAGGGGVYQEAF